MVSPGAGEGGRMLKFLRSAFSFERLLGMALLIGFMFLYYVDPYPVQFLRLKTFDYYQQQKPREIPPPQGKPVTIIDLDEESLAEIGQWPWPRTTVAKLIENLTQMVTGGHGAPERVGNYGLTPKRRTCVVPCVREPF